MSEKIIDEFFAAEAEENPSSDVKYPRHNRRELRQSFFRKEKYNPDNPRRYLSYVDDTDFAVAHIDALLSHGKFENNQCRCTVLWKAGAVVVVHVENKINAGASDIRLRKYPYGWREDYRSWEIRRPSWRPVYYKRIPKNTPGMKQMANKHIRHKARLFMRDGDACEEWKEEIAPSAHAWYKRAFCSYDICDY